MWNTEQIRNEVETAAQSGSYISLKEYNDLINAHPDQEDEVTRLVSERTKNIAYVPSKLKEVLDKYNAQHRDILNDTRNQLRWSREANELIDNLNDVDKYLTALNKVYWGREDAISKHNWLLGIIGHLGQTDYDMLFEELKPSFNLDANKKEALAGELGLEPNSDKFNEWLKRTAVIAVIGAILSGGSTLALEIFWINMSENYSDGPEMEKVIKALRNKNVDISALFEQTIKSGETTLEQKNTLLDVLNNPSMDTANIKRLIDEIHTPNWFQKTFGIFMPDWYKELEKLTSEFEQSNDVVKAKDIIVKVGELLEQWVLSAQKEFERTKKNFEISNKEYNEQKDKGYNSFMDEDFARVEEANRIDEYYFKEAKEDYKSALAWIDSFAKILNRYYALAWVDSNMNLASDFETTFVSTWSIPVVLLFGEGGIDLDWTNSWGSDSAWSNPGSAPWSINNPGSWGPL